uniref:FAD dependent oxidoreductase domain-containing protein n=1 Tax=Panagrolaimus davidi TaxID=227884 RepID=A0A914QS90_9BILA
MDVEITIFSDLPFEKTTSWGPAGLHRIDNGMYRKWGNLTFQRYSNLFRDIGGTTGIQKLSGNILSEDIEKLRLQERNYGDIVYDFHFLSPRELLQFNSERTNLSGIHFTAFTTEGRKYVPWMTERLKGLGVHFIQRHVLNVLELINEGFDVVVNCAGIRGGEVADDGDSVNVYPIRGVLFQVDAPWQKQFLYEDFTTFTIPTIESVYMGTVKEINGMSTQVSPEEREAVRQKYIKLQPAFKNVSIISEWVGFRPSRDPIRLEAIPFNNDLIIHNYGHGGNGFTLSWGCALEVVELIKNHFN